MKTFSQETRRKISKALKGKPKSDVAKKNMSTANRGKPWTEKQRESILAGLPRGENHHKWKKLPSYSALHQWVVKNKGTKKGKCAACSKVQYTEWALKKGEVYGRDPSRFEELCLSCHRKRDAHSQNKILVWSRTLLNKLD